jgi:RNA methyltransferase, RsmE family
MVIFETITAEVGDIFLLSSDNARHVAGVLRTKVGESVIICDGARTNYVCTVFSIDAQDVHVRVEYIESCQTELPAEVTLYACLPKGDKLSFIVEKAVELGAAKIVPVLSQYCVSRPSVFEPKRKRLGNVARSAAEQCGRGIIPEVADIITFEEAVKAADILFYENAESPVKGVENLSEVGVIIGSEGGFSEEEVAFAKDKGLQIATLGKRILRCETAAVTALSLIMGKIEKII